jgi:protein O-mannosyl-transferase
MDDAARRAWSWRRLVPGTILVVAAFLVYFPTLHGDWLWDDNFLVRFNPLMAEAGGWWKFWFAPPGPEYLPLSSTLEWVLWRVFGDHTLPFHVVSIALHLASAFLLWRLLARLGLRLAWLGALLFLVHPLAVESVSWISELKNTLSLPLLLLCLLFWLDYDERPRPAVYSAALLFFLAALLAKTSVVMLPFILLLHAWWKHGRVTREKWISVAAFFAGAAVLGLLTIFFQNRWAIGAEPIAIGGLPERAAGAGRALCFYFGKFFWPLNLMPAYPPWNFDPLTPAEFLPWLGIAATGGLLWWERTTAWGRAACLGLGFFVLNLAPVLGFLPMSYMRIAWVADHFTYVAMIGLIGLIVAGVDFVLARLPRFLLPPAAGTLVLITFSLAWQSCQYAANFRDQVALWSYNLRLFPNSWLAELNLGLSLTDAHRLPEALDHLNRAVQLRGDFYGTHLALANVLASLNRLDEAAAHYQIAARLRPDSLETHLNYGAVLLRQGDVHGAEVQCGLAVWFDPDSAAAHYDYANVLLRENRVPDAIRQYQLTLEAQPDFAAASNVLGKLHAPLAPSAAK